MKELRWGFKGSMGYKVGAGSVLAMGIRTT